MPKKVKTPIPVDPTAKDRPWWSTIRLWWPKHDTVPVAETEPCGHCNGTIERHERGCIYKTFTSVRPRSQADLESSAAVNQQSAPIPNRSICIWESIIADVSARANFPAGCIEDMRERDRFGTAKYGTPLQPNNGRDPLIDSYQEALDLAAYSHQLWIETGDWEDLYEEAVTICARLYRAIEKRKAKLSNDQQ